MTHYTPPVQTPAASLPSPGQLVTVRQRRYVVTDIAAGAVQRDLFADLAAQTAQHLVSLQSVEDDGLGEELQVIWEIEPGTHVHDRAALPDPTAGCCTAPACASCPTAISTPRSSSPTPAWS